MIVHVFSISMGPWGKSKPIACNTAPSVSLLRCCPVKRKMASGHHPWAMTYPHAQCLADFNMIVSTRFSMLQCFGILCHTSVLPLSILESSVYPLLPPSKPTLAGICCGIPTPTHHSEDGLHQVGGHKYRRPHVDHFRPASSAAMTTLHKQCAEAC